jgi:hypothetical protein
VNLAAASGIEPIWTDEALEFAESIRKGQPIISVTRPADLSDTSYVNMMLQLRDRYPR